MGNAVFCQCLFVCLSAHRSADLLSESPKAAKSGASSGELILLWLGRTGISSADGCGYRAELHLRTLDRPSEKSGKNRKIGACLGSCIESSAARLF